MHKGSQSDRKLLVKLCRTELFGLLGLLHFPAAAGWYRHAAAIDITQSTGWSPDSKVCSKKKKFNFRMLFCVSALVGLIIIPAWPAAQSVEHINSIRSEQGRNTNDKVGFGKNRALCICSPYKERRGRSFHYCLHTSAPKSDKAKLYHFISSDSHTRASAMYLHYMESEKLLFFFRQ